MSKLNLMKYLLVVLTIVLAFSCKPCRECKYSTLKDTYGDQTCSTIKADLEAFEAKWDSLATANGSEVVCTKEKY